MISVIVCTHNPREEYLSRTLTALQRQSLAHEEWELLVIDNASTERLDARLDLSWHIAGRVVRENELGLTPARLRGIRESKGEVLVFVDDDNVLADDYLEKVRSVASTHPFLGAWSGTVKGEFEIEPPQWTRRYWGNLVIRDVPRDAWSNIYWHDQTTPLGAGLCVRRTVAGEYLRLHDEGIRTFKMDRAGQNLVSGGDNDLSACAIDIGLACGVIASLRLTHLIPRERLTEAYLLSLAEGVAYSSIILHSFREATRNGVSLRGSLNRVADIVRRARMSPRERRFHAAVLRGQRRATMELESH
ncbi:MAG TPA: glycosyltransferase [Gemmatimonadaceae bacterium]|jgi:glycosyltransferase involved in cell wall biosynthesis